MEQLPPEKNRLSHLRGFLVEGVPSIQGPREPSHLPAVIRLDHNYSCISEIAQQPNSLEDRYLKNAAVLPDILPAASVSSVNVYPAPLCQQEQSVSIHGCSVQGYQAIYRSVAEPMIKTHCGKRRPYSLKLGLKTKQRLWETLNCPSLVETEQPDGRVLITESFSTTSRGFAPQIHVDISEEPLPEEPRRKKPRH